jgi:hypothetical protein
MFLKISQFAEANDFYDSKNIIEVKFKVSYDQPTLIQSIKTIL